MRKTFLFLLGIFAVAVLIGFSSFVFAAVPNGATVAPVANDTAGIDSAESHAAIAGNISEITLEGDVSSQAWQGYYGNVTGTIELADGSNFAMYNWTQTTATGEVYASLNSSIGWAGIMCFNISTDHTDQLSDLESFFNIDSGDVDGIDATFSDATHSPFITGGISFTANQCNSTDIFGPGGAATFEEILLIDASNRTVYASILDDDTTGFDGLAHDFEMIVPEDGHAADTTPTPYYFYVELEG